jgi:hypothetical protein
VRIFTIDAGNTIALSASTERSSKSRAAVFTTEKQLAALAAHWPIGRLVEIWNHLPGVRKIAKFTDRRTRGLRRQQRRKPERLSEVTELIHVAHESVVDINGGKMVRILHDYATVASPFFSTSDSSLSEAPEGRFSPRSHLLTKLLVTFR